ncbi:MAG: NAD(P)-dependent oxidoreductase [Rubrivivax sp.]|nr:NAD(P)-dependent oxidoreductase [Rubrivivax sp.]
MILVTGASGIVGKAVMARARQLGLDALGLARTPDGDPQSTNIACDLATCAPLPNLVARRPSVIIHLAAAVPHSPRYPDTEASAALTRRVDACVHAAAEEWRCHVVYASSCGLYDRLSPRTKSESSDDLIRIASPYFAAKRDGERLFAGLQGCTVLRLPAPVGPGVPPGLVVARFVAQALAGEKLAIWGSGKREQNFVDATDLAEAALAAARVRWPGTINIAAARPVTMLELAHCVVEVVGRGSVALSGQPDPRDAETARYSTERAASVLGWTPKVSLASSIRSLAEHLSASRQPEAERQ